MEIIYNSHNNYFKQPFGAVKTSEMVLFTVLCSEMAEVKIVVRNDDFSYIKSFNFEFICEEKGYYKYSTNIRLDNPDLYFYRFEVSHDTKIYFCGSVDCELKKGDFLPEWQLTVYDKEFVTPQWLKGGIMYQIFPDRFCRSEKFTPLQAVNERVIHSSWYDVPNSVFDTKPYKADDFFCGNLDGIIEQLDYLKTIGINALYLNPIFESAENHRYSTADYLNIDPYLGTNDDFVRLSEECKTRDIKIILDGVFNHTGADSIYFNRYKHYDSIGAYMSKDSEYYNWYKFTNYPDEYESWWGFENLPTLNENNEKLLSFIAGKEDSVLSFWHDKGCNGWRLDVADELPDVFLDILRSTVKALDKDAVIIGEVWEDASNKTSYSQRRRYLLGKQLDSAMNYPFKNAIIDFVIKADVLLFKNRIMRILENYPQPVIDVLMNVLSTHDTVRIITQLGVLREVKNENKSKFVMTDDEYNEGKKRLKMAAFLQFTLPGVPSIYYGDEVGLQGFADPFCRTGYPYGREDKDLLHFYISLSKLRVEHRENFYNSFSLIYAEKSVFAFKRGKIHCFVNNSDNEQFISTSGLLSTLIFNIEPVISGNGIKMPPKSFCATF
jgi:cyclomaltodextrinase